MTGGGRRDVSNITTMADLRKHTIGAFGLVLALACVSLANAQVTDREIPLNGATSLRLNVSGSIHLVPGRAGTPVLFHVVDSGPSIPPMSVKMSHTGSRLDVSITGPSESILPFIGASGYELVVTYPPELKLDLREFMGRVHVDRVTAPMLIYDADGNIVVDDAPSSLTAEADSGDIDVTGARAGLTLTTINGNVVASLAPGYAGRLVRLEAQSGNLQLHVPAGFAGHYDLTTGQGHVSNALRSSPKGPLVFMLAEQGNISIAAL
jgi:hypothetical protein